ncbi:MAG: OPT/YSL family transporter [Patescibacteria group bacterium]
MTGPLSPRLLILGVILCVIAALAGPYVTLKLGMSVDLSYGGMFLAAALLAKGARDNRELAVQLNIIQAMINAVSGVGFMVVILAAFHYIKGEFGRDIDFNPTWWQMGVWLTISAYLGVFVGAIPRRTILADRTLTWPAARGVLVVAHTLTDPAATALNTRRKAVLSVTTALAGFLTFLRDSLGVITPIVGNKALNLMMGLEFVGLGFGMLVPLGIGLSGLLGVWILANFGETVGQLAALSGTSEVNWAQCRTEIAAGEITDFLRVNCGEAAKYLGAGSHFKHIVLWMMWPATAMMVASALTSVVLSLAKNALMTTSVVGEVESQADEHIPTSWIVGGTIVCIGLLIFVQDLWFDMPWYQVMVAIAIQPVLIVAGLRVLGLTGQGPVSLMANATQFLFGLIWPAHVKENLVAAQIAADPAASSEGTISSFWVAQRLGGSFRTLIVAQLLMLPIGAFLLPVTFTMLANRFGIGLEPGQLAAPTGLKIASLAIVMEKGLTALPHGALTASIAAIVFGILVEILLTMTKTDAEGNEVQRFPWLPVPSALGFSLILPPTLSIATAVGSMISFTWRKVAGGDVGSYILYGAPIAAGLMAGEAIVGGILLPILATLVEFVNSLLS